jgi:molybdopterin-containing oxidoreductase family iron-sulfur binding subunit
VKALNDSLASGKVLVLFVHGANPVYSAPAALKFKDNLKKAGFKVVFAHYMDETALEADLVLPLDSALEDWASSVPEYAAEGVQLSIQQPLMEKLHANTRGTGDILLALLKQRRADEYKNYEDFYAYLRSAVVALKGTLGGAGKDDDLFWSETLSAGLVKLPGTKGNLSAKATADVQLPAAAAADSAYPLQLIPYVSANMRDGRNANQPWLQESPDPLTTIVWDSWVEIHPQTAAKLGIVEGDIVEVTSRSGSLKAQAYVFPGIHPDAISIPLGYGHEAMGRYAKGIGANAFAILDPILEKATGELAYNETRVKLSKVGKHIIVVKEEGAAGGSQAGKPKIAVRVASDKVDLSKEV